MSLPKQIKYEIEEYFLPHFDMYSDDYVCMYGSSVYDASKVSSDVDLFLVTHDVRRIALEGIIKFTVDFHNRHGRRIDEEVPYENKIHYCSDEIDNALCFSGFTTDDGKVTVPAIRKEPDFLKSPEIKARLALNALTTPHLPFALDLRKYKMTRHVAEISATLLAANQITTPEFDVAELYKALVKDRYGNTGEMFLGYKTEYPIVESHLTSILENVSDELADKRIFERTTPNTYQLNVDRRHSRAIMFDLLNKEGGS